MALTARRRRTLRKLPYYARSLAALARIATLPSIARCIFLPRSRRLELREGRSLRVTTPVDLLVLKETWLDDAYRLREIEAGESSVIVDVGAGIGDFALAAARRFPGARICAFEPNPLTYRLLETNLRAFGAATVVPVQAAIGTQPSYLLGRPSAGARASVVGAAGDGVAVRGVRLDDVVPEGRVAMLKIDCEGLELEVLRSAQAVLERTDVVALEYHRALLPLSDELVAEFLEARGFATRAQRDPYDDAIGYVYATRLIRSPAEQGRRRERS